jgi:DNA sulfur modification protein DndD
MILSKLLMRDFRQFRGEHKLVFSGGEEARNVTIVIGPNGRGKTGILRALFFCLFGDRTLAQDAGVDETELALVNRAALQESEGRPVSTMVEVCFAHGGSEYSAVREAVGMKKGKRILEQENGFSLRVTGPEGNTTVISDRTEAMDAVSGCIDPRVKEYFFFDGEKIERLTRANVQQRQDVSKGIRSILRIDAVQTAHKALSRLHRKLNEEAGRKTGGEYGRTLKACDDCESQLDSGRGKIEDVDEEIQAATEEIEAIDDSLRGVEGIEGLLDERRRLEETDGDADEELGASSARCQQILTKVATNLINPALDQVFAEIDGKKRAGVIPAEIRGEVIDRILDVRVCMCGRTVEPNSKEHESILQWKHRSIGDHISDFSLELWRHLSGIRANRRSPVEEANVLLQKMAVLAGRKQQAASRLAAISAEIGSGSRADAVSLQDQRTRVSDKLLDLAAQRLQLLDAEEKLRKELSILENKKQQVLKKQGIQNEMQRRAEVVAAACTAVSNILDDFSSEIRTALGKVASDFFRQLLDDEGSRNLGGICVGKDYSLQVLDRWGEPFLANISSGQRQIMSVSFILALAQLAAGNSRFEVPLFMDTPFGRISKGNREALIGTIPDACSQWILLATDTEIGGDEMSALRASGRVGSFYHLKVLEDGSSFLEEAVL